MSNKKQKKAIQEPSMSYAGPSADHRTNRWRVYCACGHTNNPSTTMLSRQTVTCERCSRMYSCNYNDQTIKELAQ